MITEQDIEHYKGASEAFEAAKEVIVNRIDEVIKIIAKVFNKKISCWWFPDAQEGKLGDLDSCIASPYYKDGYDEIDFEMDRGHVSILRGNPIWRLMSGIILVLFLVNSCS